MTTKLNKGYGLIILDGKRFGRLIVIYRSGTSNSHDPLWLCKCDCGTMRIIAGSSLRRELTTSCGCLQKENIVKRMTKHGMSHTKIYGIWEGMIERCHNPLSNNYRNYGMRGISVCERWRFFENFLEDMGEAILGMSIDRINNDGNYEPNNCRWATKKEQSRNKRTNRLITVHGKMKTVKEWSEITGLPETTLGWRARKGWPEYAILKRSPWTRLPDQEEQHER